MLGEHIRVPKCTPSNPHVYRCPSAPWIGGRSGGWGVGGGSLPLMAKWSPAEGEGLNWPGFPAEPALCQVQGFIVVDTE